MTLLPDECSISRDQAAREGTHRYISLSQGVTTHEDIPLPPDWVRRIAVQQAVRFDPQRRAASPELQRAITSLGIFLEQRERALGLRQRHRSKASHAGLMLAVEALACNFGRLLAADLEPILSVPRESGVIWGKHNGRYRSPVYGQHFIDALDLMAHPEIGLIESVMRGFRDSESGHGQRSVIRLRGAFFEHVLPSVFEPTAVRREVDPEVLILRGYKTKSTDQAEAIDYPETPLTQQLREEVRRINAYLDGAPIILLHGYQQLRADDGQPVDPLRRTVRRIFNNASWEDGGRLYGALWETMKREDRFRFLRISTRSGPEGEPIANVDYGQLYPRLAYLEVGLPPPEGDLYDITKDGQHREGWKQLVNALLLTNKAFHSWPKDAARHFPPGTKLRAVIAAIISRHAPIAHLFGSGTGIKLMKKESDMLVATLLRLFGQRVTALPLHDSVLCAKSDAPAAESVMRKVFTDFTGGAQPSIKTTTS